MNKYRIRFSKIGKIKYVGHLDVLNIFQRAIKRAKLPIAYSKGFNPHQLMGFAIPLPLGMESVAEYLDIQLDSKLEPEEIKTRLNKTMPIGMEILNVVEMEEGQKSGASIVESGDYKITLDKSISKEDIEKFLAQDEILVEKISKKRGKEVLKTVDIKEDILDLKISNDKELLATISTGSAKNLKPEVLINRIYNFLNLPYDKYKILYKRMELFDGNKIKLDECK